MPTSNLVKSLAAISVLSAFAAIAGCTGPSSRTTATQALEAEGITQPVFGETSSIRCPDDYNLMGIEFSGRNADHTGVRGVVCLDTQKPAKVVLQSPLF